MAGCMHDAGGNGTFCRKHWRAIPADLRERIRWALDGEDAMDLEAAIQAAMTTLE